MKPGSSTSASSRSRGTTPSTPTGSCTDASHASGSTHLNTSRVWASHDQRRFIASSSSARQLGRERRPDGEAAERLHPGEATQPRGTAMPGYVPAHGTRGPGRRRPREAAARHRRDDRRPRSRAGRGAGAGAGVRRVPHRPALPGGRDQRRLPVPARPRGGRGGGGGRPGRGRRGARRLRDPQLAGGVRRVPVVPAGAALVLLLHPQRHAEDDARRHRAVAGARHRRLRREDAGRRGAVHQGVGRR